MDHSDDEQDIMGELTPEQMDLLVQLQDNQPLRSRHSSAESEPAMRSGVAAPLVLNDGRALGGRFDESLSSTLAHIQTG